MEAFKTLESIEKMSKFYNDLTTIDPMAIIEPFKQLTWLHLASIVVLILFIKDPFGFIYFLFCVMYWLVIIGKNLTNFLLDMLINASLKLINHLQTKWHSSELKNMLNKENVETFVRHEGQIVNIKELNSENDIKNVDIVVSSEKKTELTESQVELTEEKIGMNF